jgi:protein-tyrosine-phosphatase
MSRVSVLFVDLGNICRAPMAEILFLHLARQRGWADRFQVDSCGTGDFHTGKSADSRALKVLIRHGISIHNYSHSARQLQFIDLARFDYILCMDQLILGQVRQLACGPSAVINPASSTGSLHSTGATTSPSTGTTGSAVCGGTTTPSPPAQPAAHSSSPSSSSPVHSSPSIAGSAATVGSPTDHPVQANLTHSVADSLGGEQQHSQSPGTHCAIHLLGEFFYHKQLALNQKVDSKDFLVSDPFYNPSEEPFELVYEKCAQYVEAFLDTFAGRLRS